MAKSKLRDKVSRTPLSSSVKHSTPSLPSTNKPEEEYTMVKTDLIIVNENIRKTYDDSEIQELAESMKEYGQLQPIRVYEKGLQYCVIFGHRRLLAARLIKLPEMKILVSSKPDNLNTIYIQAVENEHAVNISSPDREKYIKALRDMGESFEEIARKIGKSVSWVRECSVAGEVREKHQNLLDASGIQLSTEQAYALRNATAEDAEEAILQIVEHPEDKTVLLKKVNERTKKKRNVGRKSKDTKASVDSAPEMELPTSANPSNEEEKPKLQDKLLKIIWTNDQKDFAMRMNDMVDSNDPFTQQLTELIRRFFTEQNYREAKI